MVQKVTKNQEQKTWQSFVLQLSDAIQSESNPVRVIDAVTLRVMNYFNTDNCYYYEIEDSRVIIRQEGKQKEFIPLSNTYPIEDNPVLKIAIDAGRTLAVPDVNTTRIIDADLKQLCLQKEIVSFLGIPVIKKGKTVGILCMTGKTPGDWTDNEIELAEEIANRTWVAVERTKAERALRQSEESYRAIVNQSIAGIFTIDLQGKFIYSNHHFSKMTGYSISELLQLSTNDLVYTKDIKKTNDLFSGLVNEGKSYEIEKRLRKKDGSLIWVKNNVSPIQNGFTGPGAAVGVSIDITQQKAIEQQKEDFISIASHELKTPVTSIKMYVDLIHQLLTERADKGNAELMKKLEKQVDRLIGLINDLLDTSRIAQGRLELHPEQFNLNKMIRECVTVFQSTSKKHNFILHTGEIGEITADPHRIEQVLNNLISNAVKYSPEGGAVTITSKKEGRKIKVSVEDEGIGIPKDVQSKLFKRFSRIDYAQNFQGVGLGLYICADIIRRQGGEIAVKSPPEHNGQNNKHFKGSVFSFTLPLNK